MLDRVVLLAAGEILVERDENERGGELKEGVIESSERNPSATSLNVSIQEKRYEYNTLSLLLY